jgi:thiol:disulfide interchange protein DsbC
MVSKGIAATAVALSLLPVNAFAQHEVKLPEVGAGQLTQQSFTQTPIPGLEVASWGSSVYYMSADRKYVLVGELFDVTRNVNLTESLRRIDRVRLLSAVDRNDLIRVPYQGTQSTKPKILYVFMRLDCPFCAKLHSEVSKLMEQGFAIEYLIYARAEDSQEWAKASAVMCAQGRFSALDSALAGGGAIDSRKAKPDESSCDDADLRLHQELARAIGVEAVPTIVTDSGRLIQGYPGYEWLTKNASDKALPPWSMDQLHHLYEKLGNTAVHSD